MSTRSDELAVRTAVDQLVAAFGRGDLPAYFGAFHRDASFLFYTTPRPLEGVDSYRSEWDRWASVDGFEVLECRTSDTRVEVWSDVAIVTHAVATRSRTHAGVADTHERETIVFQRQADGRWLAIHEHLSPAPD